MAGPKCTAVEKERRVLLTMGFIREGLRAEDILKFTTESKDPAVKKKQIENGYVWNIKIDMIRQYISEAIKRFRKVSQVDEAYQKGLALERFENLYNRSYKIQDYRTCLAIVKEMNAFFGFNTMTVKHESGLSNEIAEQLEESGGIASMMASIQKIKNEAVD